MTFTEELRNYISENWRDEPFTFNELAHIAKRHGKALKSITHVLRDLEEKNLIAMVGKQKNKSGGFGSKIYQVVEDADLSVQPAHLKMLEAKRAMKLRETKMVQAANRLSDALDRMVRA